MPVTQCATAAFDDHDLMPLLCRRIAISLKLHETSGGFRGKRGASHDAAFFASLFVNFSAHGRLLRENEDFTRKYTEKIRTFKVLDKKSRTTTLSKDTMASWPRHWSRCPRNISGALTLHGSPWKCSSERALRAPPLLSGCFSKIFKASQVKVSEHSKFWRCKSEMYSIHFHFSFHFASPCHRFSSTSLSDKCQIWIFSKLHLFSSTTAAACYMAPGLQQLCEKLLQPQTMLQLSGLATPATTHLGQQNDAEFKCYACYPKTVKSRWHLCLEAELVAQRCHPARNEEEMSLNVKTSQVHCWLRSPWMLPCSRLSRRACRNELVWGNLAFELGSKEMQKSSENKYKIQTNKEHK